MRSVALCLAVLGVACSEPGSEDCTGTAPPCRALIANGCCAATSVRAQCFPLPPVKAPRHWECPVNTMGEDFCPRKSLVGVACTSPKTLQQASPSPTLPASPAIDNDHTASAPDWDDAPPIDPSSHRPTPLDPLSTATAFSLGPQTLIVLSRSACHGDCPVYSVGITSDGGVHFFGALHTATPGYATNKVSVRAVQGLLAFLRGRHFLRFHTHYHRHATDHASAVILLRQGNQWKYVEHDLSNTSEPALAEIETEIDRVTGSARWVSLGPPAAPGMPTIPAAALAQLLGEERLRTIPALCSTRGKISVKVEVGIDHLGGVRARAFNGGSGYSPECIQTQLDKVFLPIVSVDPAGEITLGR